MFTIRTEDTTSPSGLRQVVATGHDVKRTIRSSQSRTAEQDHATAAGTLLNVLANAEQQAKVRHPSGGQRVRTSRVEVAPNVFAVNWYIDV